MPPHVPTSRGHAAAGGIVAGLIGGAVIASVMLATALAKHHDLWPVLKGAAAPLLYERAAQPGADLAAVLTSLVGHLAISAGWGALFAALCHGLGPAATVAAGVAWGVVVWLVMFYAVLPLLGLAAMARAVPTSSAVAEHILFGLGLGVGFLPFQRGPHEHDDPEGTAVAPAHVRGEWSR